MPPPLATPVRVFFCCVLLASLSSCQNTTETPEIALGRSHCHVCDRPIADLSWAAASSGAGQRLYDDPGCLFKDLRSTAPPAGAPIFHDRRGNSWLAAADAWFAQVSGVKSPAEHGWAAFASFADAQDAVTKAGGGRILRFDQVLQETGSGN